ncbi:MAG TPA: TonB-dependent receptor [Pyrinomonadaceae bacterium]|nr:TonB-dependent receptor [Pyrinomonadaceae bacterium]
MKKIVPFLAIILSLAIGVFAQSQATSGNIEGRVVDQNGAIVTNATVTVTNQDTGFGKTASTDSDGSFIFVLLPPGKYKVEANAQGFSKATYENVVVTVGAKRTLEINLSVNSQVNVVDVQAGGDVVETTRTSISSTVDEKRVTNLPTNGRNFLDFVTLTPGIVRDPTRSGDLAVGGQKGTLNSLQIDGASSDNTFFGQSSGRIGSGRAPSQFSVDTVKEFQVNQNGFSAEFGRAAGAVINVVTKSGTNTFSGSAFYYFRDESLNAKNPSFTPARAKPFGQINQFGGTFGGPIKKDKVFFFGAYEGQRSDLPNPVIVNSLPFAPANVIALLTPKINSYNINRQQNTYLGKVDFNLNENNQVWVRFNQQNFTGTNLESSGTLSAEEHTGNSNVKTSTLTSSWTHTLSPKWFNEFRFQYARDRQPGLANSSSPEVNVTANAGGINDGTFAFGRNNFSPRETTIKRYQFINNQTYLTGNHTIKYGADLLFDRIFNFFPGLFSGSYTFPSYAALSTSTPSRYRQSFAGTGTTGAETHPDNNEYGFFVQDDWRVHSNISINLGLRYDYQRIAKPQVQNPNAALLAAGFDTSYQPKDKNNFAPRLGLSYSFDSKSVFRVGYGMFFGRTPAIATGTVHSNNGIQVIAIDINCTATPALCPTYPNVFTAIPTNVAAVTPNLFLFGRNYQQPFTHQARIQYEREIIKNTTFSIQYAMFRGADLSRSRNANLVAPVQTILPIFTSAGVDTGRTLTVQRFSNARPNTAFQRITLFESTAKSLYEGLTFELNRRFSNNWQFGMSYTLSEALDNKPDQTAVVVGGGDDAKIAENQFDLTGEWGRSDLDVRHRFIFNTVYETGTFKYTENKALKALLSDYIVTGIFTAQSGFAFSAVVSGDPNADGNTSNDRAPGSLRNQFSTAPTYIFDLRVGRAIKFGEKYRLSLFAEGFNIFNRANVQQVNNTLYAFSTTGGGRLTQSTNFNTPRTFISGSPSFTFNSSYNRELQLGIRFDF